MRPVRCRKTSALLVLLLFIGSLPAQAQEAKLNNIIVTNTRDDLLVYLTVEGAFREEMQEAVLSGVPTTFSFFVNLYRVRNFWPDEGIAALKLTHTLKYNNLRKEFIVTRSWENDKQWVTQSFAEAQRLMSEIDSLPVVPLSRLEKGKQYQIQAKAELSELTLPFYLHYILFFVSLWDFETDWQSVDFLY
jgi:hypothetical protein